MEAKPNFEEFFDTLSTFYASSMPTKNTSKYLILANNRYKIAWDMYVTVLLLFLTVIVPVRLAFADEDPLSWKIIYNWIDISFLIDIILTFFTSYTNDEGIEECEFR